MRTYTVFCILTFLLTACTQNSGPRNTNSDPEIRKQVIGLLETYAKNKLKGAEKTVASDGSIIFSSEDIKCVIDPSNIILGEINEDALKDAVCSIYTYQGQGMPLKEHFILINNNGSLSIVKELNGDMKFLSISNRTIFIETSKMASDSPFADCQVCKVIKKYKFIGGDTVVIK